MKKSTLQAVLEAHKGDDYALTADRDYHEPEEIMDCVREAIEYADDEIHEADDLRDAINEHADSATPVYNSGLAAWFGDNWSAVDDYLDEVGEPVMIQNGNRQQPDIMRTIMAAYCMSLEREAFAALESVWEEAEELEANAVAETLQP